MDELKPCPFCGSKAKLIHRPKKISSWAISCTSKLADDCQLYSGQDTRPEKDWDDVRYWFANKDEAIKTWNTRASQPANGLVPLNKMEDNQPKWPLRREKTKLGIGTSDTGCEYCHRELNYCECYKVFNDAIHACIQAFEEWRVSQPVKGLVPLERDKMSDIFDPGEVISVPKTPKDLTDIINILFNRICSKFGQKPLPSVSVEEIEKCLLRTKHKWESLEDYEKVSLPKAGVRLFAEAIYQLINKEN